MDMYVTVQDIVCNYLTSKRWLMNDKLRYGTASDNLTDKNKKLLEVRLNDNSSVVRELERLKFTSIIPDEIKPLLSPYGTFCDNSTFYFDSSLKDYSDQKITEIVCCEYFNVNQAYYAHSTLRATTSLRIQGVSILTMYHIGLINQKIWYAQSIRNDLMEKIAEKYPDFDVISFMPNDNACQYLYDKMIYDDPDDLLAIHKNKHETANVVQYTIVPKYWLIRENDGIEVQLHSNGPFGFKESTVFLKKLKDGTLGLTSKSSHEVKEHIEIIKLAEKLQGTI